TISMTNIPLIDLLRYVTSLAGLDFVVTSDAFVLQPAAPGLPAGGAGPAPVPSVPGSSPAGATRAGAEGEKAAGAAASAGGDSKALAKATAIIIPRIELREATLAEAVD